MELDNTAKTYIWRLSEINKTEICSGDSKGQVIIWDSINYIETARFTENKSDITTICTSNQINDCIYATGVDSKIISLSKIESKGWVYTSCIRGQSHDINAICLTSQNELISGGVTTDICVYPLQNGRFKESFGAQKSHQIQTKLRHVPPFPMKNVISLTKNNDLLLLELDNELQIWGIDSLVSGNVKLELAIKKKKGAGILTSKISQDGKFICYSDINGVTIYNIYKTKGIMNAKKADYKFIKNCQVLLEFGLDNKTLYTVSVDGVLSILDLENNTLTQFILKDPDTSKKLNVRMAQISSSFEYLLFVTQDGSVWSYSLISKEIHWKLPFSGVATCIKSFEDSRAFIIGDKNEIFIYDLLHKSLDPWSKQYGKSLPANYLDRFNRVYDIVQLNSHKYLLYTHYTFIVLDMELSVPHYSRCVTNKAYVYSKTEDDLKEAWAKLTSAHQTKLIREFTNFKIRSEIIKEDTNKIEENKGNEADNMAIYNKYSVILGMKYDNNEKRLFVIESPWSKILKTFPGALQIHKYGN